MQTLSRSDAEAQGFKPRASHDPIWFRREGPERPGPGVHSKIERVYVLTDLESVLVEALERAERKLSAYVGVCAGDKELTNTVLPMARAALAEARSDH